MEHIEDKICDTAKARLGATKTILHRLKMFGEVKHYALRALTPDGWKFIGRAETKQGLLDVIESLPFSG